MRMRVHHVRTEMHQNYQHIRQKGKSPSTDTVGGSEPNISNNLNSEYGVICVILVCTIQVQDYEMLPHT
jgi:hypothetical protein